MLDILLKTFAAIGLSFSAYYAVKFTSRSSKCAAAWAAHRKVWGKEVRVVTIDRITVAQEVIAFIRSSECPRVEGCQHLRSLLEHVGIGDCTFGIIGKLRLNNGAANDLDTTFKLSETDDWHFVLLMLAAIAGRGGYFPAYDFRSAVTEPLQESRICDAAREELRI